MLNPDDIIATYVYLKGVDHIRVKAPRYVLPFKAPGVNGKYLFATHPKLPPGSALIGRDLGDSFFTLFDIAKLRPHSVYLTQAQTKSLEQEEHEREMKQALEGAVPLALENILDVQTEPDCGFSLSFDCVSDTANVASPEPDTSICDSEEPSPTLPDTENCSAINELQSGTQPDKCTS